LPGTPKTLRCCDERRASPTISRAPALHFFGEGPSDERANRQGGKENHDEELSVRASFVRLDRRWLRRDHRGDDGIDTAPTGTTSAAITTTTAARVTHSTAIAVDRVRILVNVAKLQDRGRPIRRRRGLAFDLSKDEITKGAHRDFTVSASTATTYTDAEIEIDHLDSDRNGGGDASGAQFDDFRTSGASLLVDGTFTARHSSSRATSRPSKGKEERSTSPRGRPSAST